MPPAPIDTTSLDLEARTDAYITRLAQIDRILAGPLRTLISEAARAQAEGAPDEPPRFRQWLSRTDPLDTHSSRIATSLCVVTLQRFHTIRRRFPALEKDFQKLNPFVHRLSDRYLPSRTGRTDREYFEACCRVVDSNVHGILNPFTAAQVFRVLMETGEDHAHSGLGCMSFFAMVWPLLRQDRENPLDLGARIEPGQPNAYVTAKCLLPLIRLRNICEQRAELTLCLGHDLHEMHTALGRVSHGRRSRWLYCAQLADLVKHLSDLARISIAAPALRGAARKLTVRLEQMQEDTNLEHLHRHVLDLVYEFLQTLSSKNQQLLGDAQVVLDHLRTGVVTPLLQGRVPDVAGQRLGFWVQQGERPENDRYERYAAMMGAAAAKAAGLCDKILRALEGASDLRLAPASAPLHEVQASVMDALRRLAAVNTRVATVVHAPVELQAEWCQGLAYREIAYTSADNDTDFDPAELVSSIAVGVRTNRFNLPLQLADAVEKAVLGAQRDGSWRLMHPYYSGDGSQGIRPPAADVVWTLASALSHFPEIDVADDALFRFVDWLERTQRNIVPRMDNPTPPQEEEPAAHVGWSSDQMREDHRVSLLTTAYAMNALLAIRDLVEHRMWELCRRRFTVIGGELGLSGMDPVDLLVPHRHRLHSLLARMSRDTQIAAKDAPYSLVLHGPPGSSKTAVSTALARHLWTSTSYWGAPGEPRLVRITPADFTRRGEEHVESEAQLIFRLLRKVRGVTILFDEIDDLLRRREGGPPSFLDLVVPAMLNRLQDLHEVCESQEVCFLFGTNYVERIEPALMRKGRIDRVLPVTYPDFDSRVAIVEGILDPFDFKDFTASGDDAWKNSWMQARLAWCEHLAERTGGWPWSAVRGAAKQFRDNARAAVKELEADARDRLASDAGDGTVQPVFPADVVPHLAEFATAPLEQNNPESQISADYLARLDRQRNSAELRREVLYSFAAERNDGPSPELRPYLETKITAFSSEPELRKKLMETLRRLPHLDP